VRSARKEPLRALNVKANNPARRASLRATWEAESR
jgi:hypothetical protein